MDLMLAQLSLNSLLTSADALIFSVILMPHIPASMDMPCAGWSRIACTGCFESSHSCTATSSRRVTMLSRSRKTATDTLASAMGRNLHMVGSTPLSSGTPLTRSSLIGQRSTLLYLHASAQIFFRKTSSVAL